jgi:hypothetical protein
MSQKLSRDELIELVKKITAPKNNEEDILNWLEIFERNVPHPEVSGLIYWPNDYGLGDSPSAEEIVDKALSYKPIQL